MYCYSKKENKKAKLKTVSFWMALYIFYFPQTCCRQGKKVFFPLLCSTFLCLSLSLSLSHLPKNPDTTHTPSCPTTIMKGAEGTSLTGQL
jgi:hypothetical protein